MMAKVGDKEHARPADEEAANASKRTWWLQEKEQARPIDETTAVTSTASDTATNKLTWWQRSKHWLWHHKIETTAIFVCLAGAGVILALVYLRPNDNVVPATASSSGSPGDTSSSSPPPPSVPTYNNDNGEYAPSSSSGPPPAPDEQGPPSSSNQDQELDDGNGQQQDGSNNQESPPSSENNKDWKESPMFQVLQSAVPSSLLLDGDDNDPSSSTSPQTQAARWLITGDVYTGVSSTSDNLLQRYALATLYLSTGGPTDDTVTVSAEDATAATTRSDAWTYCSAIPSPPPIGQQAAAAGTTCVVKDGRVVCAPDHGTTTCSTDDYYEEEYWYYDEEDNDRPHRFLSPVHECDWYGISCNANQQVTEIDIENNDLKGSLPAELFLLTTLERLILTNNSIGGELPPSALGNSMTGQSVLRQLRLQENALVGVIPNEYYQYLTALELVQLNHNRLYGTLATAIGNLVALEVFYVNHNGLSGHLPSELGNCTGLRKATFDHNQFVGTVPNELENLFFLESIKFVNNSLSGTMPEGLCGIPISADCLYNDETNTTEIDCPCCSRCCADGRRCQENW